MSICREVLQSVTHLVDFRYKGLLRPSSSDQRVERLQGPNGWGAAGRLWGRLPQGKFGSNQAAATCTQLISAPLLKA